MYESNLSRFVAILRKFWLAREFELVYVKSRGKAGGKHEVKESGPYRVKHKTGSSREKKTFHLGMNSVAAPSPFAPCHHHRPHQ
jgi:hypothetical protein